MKVAVLLSLLGFSTLVGCAAPTGETAADSAEAISAEPTNDGYYVVTRPDPRDCKAPLCGGFFVKSVNAASTVCADGDVAAECYASAVVFDGAGLSAKDEEAARAAIESGKGIVKATVAKQSFNGTVLGALHVSEAWIGATGSRAAGTLFRTADNGVRCITAPCPSTGAYALNGTDEQDVIDVVLERTAAAPEAGKHAIAETALRTREGILVAGSVDWPHCGSTAAPSCGPRVVATEFYLRAQPAIER